MFSLNDSFMAFQNLKNRTAQNLKTCLKMCKDVVDRRFEGITMGHHGLVRITAKTRLYIGFLCFKRSSLLSSINSV